MGFLIRCAFWLSLVLLIIPIGGAGDAETDTVGPIQALVAAREAVGDLGAICERKPDVCVTGKAALHTIGVRAREASRIAFELLDEKVGEPDATITGTVAPAKAVPAAESEAPAQ
ncbi:MAG: DUF5330 domain-containing protein [Mesorhizobium sp.]|nr:DUF5330 domain-containing protein [Mesorhizobium sp.]MCO5159937.1 DUF5330 domain-containing protein [Mesorhizobium sp.]